MMYKFRNVKDGDIEQLLNTSTENGKVDKEVIEQSVEIMVLEYNKKPIMAIGRIDYPSGDLIMVTGVWGIFSTDIKKHTKAAVKFCKDLIFDRVGYKFLVLIDENNEKFVRFVKFFGFERTKYVEEKLGTVYHLYVKET